MRKLSDFDVWMNKAENLVRTKVKGRSILGEASFKPGTLHQALTLHAVAHQSGHQSARRYNERFSLSLCAAIVDVAKRKYVSGGLWPYIEDELGERYARNLTSDAQQVWREVFIETLRNEGFPVAGSGYALVETAAMHAGIPTMCLSDWFRLTERATARVGDSPTAINNWARANRDESALRDIAKPIKDLLKHGPEFAEDLFGRALELLSSMSATYEAADLRQLASFTIEEPDLLEHEATSLANSIGLSPRWVVMVSSYLSEQGNSGRGSRRPRSEDKPKIRLDFESGQIELNLPSLSNIWEPLNWRVDLGEKSVSKIAEIDITGVNVCSKSVTIPITSPIRVVTLRTADREFPLELWPLQKSALVFSPTGAQRFIATGVIPAGQSWVLYPATMSVLVDDEVATTVAQDDPPMGWSGWKLELFTFSVRQSITLSSTDSVIHLRVKGGNLPILNMPTPMLGVRHFGQPVINSRPQVDVPEDPEGWRITIAEHRTGEVVWRQTLRESSTCTLFGGLPPQVGYFDLTIRGSLGRTITESFVLVDGMRTMWNPPIREFDGLGGMPDSTVTISASPSIRTHPSMAFCETSKNYVDVVVSSAADAKLSLRCFSPSTLIGVTDHQGVVRWGARALKIKSDQLEQLAWLHVRHPMRPTGELLVYAKSEDVQPELVQRIVPEKSMGGQRYRIASLTDTVAVYPRLALFLEDGQGIGQVVPPTVNPRLELSHDGTAIKVSTSGQINEDLELWCWASGTPWRPPQQLTISGNVAKLPEELQFAGDLLIHTRPCDDWVPEPPPSFSARKSHLAASGEPRLTGSEQRIFAVANGETVQLQAVDTDTTLNFLPHRGWLSRKFSPAARSNIAQACASIDSDIALAIAARSEPLFKMVPLLLHSGLYRRRPYLSVDVVEKLWRSNPYLAGVIGAADLYRPSAPKPGAGVVPNPGMLAIPVQARLKEQVQVDLRNLATSTFGTTYLTLISNSSDPDSARGYFDGAACALENIATDQVRALCAGLRLVPKELLDVDSRVKRVSDLALAVRVRGLHDRYRHLEPQLRNAKELIAQSDMSRHWRDVDVITPQHTTASYQWIPTFVRAACLLARSDQGSSKHEQEDWQLRYANLEQSLFDCAQIAPELVLAELVRAEALRAKSGAMAIRKSDQLE